VYKLLNCNDCDALYIGQLLGRNFKNRMDEHRRVIEAKILVLSLFPNIYMKIVILLVLLILRFFACTGKFLDKLECLKIKKSLCANENIVNDITYFSVWVSPS